MKFGGGMSGFGPIGFGNPALGLGGGGGFGGIGAGMGGFGGMAPGVGGFGGAMPPALGAFAAAVPPGGGAIAFGAIRSDSAYRLRMPSKRTFPVVSAVLLALGLVKTAGPLAVC
jgi:hypothetical protein